MEYRAWYNPLLVQLGDGMGTLPGDPQGALRRKHSVGGVWIGGGRSSEKKEESGMNLEDGCEAQKWSWRHGAGRQTQDCGKYWRKTRICKKKMVAVVQRQAGRSEDDEEAGGYRNVGACAGGYCSLA